MRAELLWSKNSQFFFYLPSTVDINEKINRKPFHVHSADFGEKFNPANPDFDRKSVVSWKKKVAQQSSQNLERNADVFLSSVTHDNDKMLWSGGKRLQSDKFALTY